MPKQQRRRKLIDKSAKRESHADRHDVEDFAATLSVSHLHCREMGHTWRPWVARYDAEHHAYERALRCTRCKTERWQTLGLSGAVLGSVYKYPDGYTCELGRIVGEGRDALRLESMTRALRLVETDEAAAS